MTYADVLHKGDDDMSRRPRYFLSFATLSVLTLAFVASPDAFRTYPRYNELQAQEQGGEGGGRRFGQRDQGGPGGQRGQGWGGGQGGERGQRGQGGQRGFSQQNVVDNMTPEIFERVKNSQFAQSLKERVGEERWAQWESGDFSSGPTAAEAAQAAQEGRPLDAEMTDEEKLEADALLRTGTVPNFTPKGSRPYSLDAENEYYQRALERRDESLVTTVPLALRMYLRYVLNKYDVNGDNVLQRSEWEGKIKDAQAVDLNGDFDLDEQELLHHLVSFSKDRTIANPHGGRTITRSNIVVSNQDSEPRILIRPASAAPKILTKEQARATREEEDKQVDAVANMSEEEVAEALNENNPAMESVEDEDLLGALLADMDESSRREYAVDAKLLVGLPVWFLARDLNGDAMLTLREFAPNLSNAAVAQFGKLDSNGDGYITIEEARAATATKKQ